MSFLALVLAVAHLFHGIVAAPATLYDQQQSGELNVQVDLKDIEIVALLGSDFLGDYGDYDYHYDYSDFTLKPITSLTTESTPAASSTVKEKPSVWSTWPTIASSASTSSQYSEEQSVTEPIAVTSGPLQSESEGAKLESSATEIASSLSVEKETIASEKNPSSTAAVPEKEESLFETPTRPLRRCNPGQARDQRGRCRLHIRRRVASSLLPYGIKLLPQSHRQKSNQAIAEK